MTRHLPTFVAHADWSTSAEKRWMATAELSGDSYRLEAAAPVGNTHSLLSRLRERAGSGDRPGTLLIGFDFPIGLPREYAQKTGIERFLDVLPRLGTGAWKDFYDVATTKEEISLGRPFYPLKPGGTTHAHLMSSLGVSAMSKLLRRCDHNSPHRVDACAIFWTLGGKQVGRATICGWRDVLAPALRRPDLDVAIWPFDGELDDLLRERSIVIVETYPAEACLHLGFPPPGHGWSKQKQEDRRQQGEHLLAWARKRQVALAKGLEDQITDGFTQKRSGDDAFDAVVGLMSMIEVVLGHREPGAPADDPAVLTIENWIFGQAPSAVEEGTRLPGSRGHRLLGVGAVRKMISLPGDLVRDIEASAAYDGTSVDAILEDALRLWLRSRQH